MHMRLIAVGDRQPSWVDAAVDDYVRRLPRQWRFLLEPVSLGKRAAGGSANTAIAEEGRKILGRVKPGDFLVVLDERGDSLSSTAFADRLDEWQQAGRDIAFVIGGPDGVSGDCMDRADFCLSLSPFTLPHGLARIMLIEQLYRAWSLSAGHPYHRT